jgi:hypothetical protein
VKCEECRCWLDKSDAQEIKTTAITIGENYIHAIDYRCNAHRTPYSSVLIYPRTDLEPRYYGEVEMTKDGKPIKK